MHSLVDSINPLSQVIASLLVIQPHSVLLYEAQECDVSANVPEVSFP